MELFIDEKKTFGDILFLKAEEWKKYDTQEIMGVKLSVVSLKNFEKFNVKIPDVALENFENIKFKSVVSFDFLRVCFYIISGKKIISFYANDVDVLNEI